MPKENKSILVSTGVTGGHFFPSICFAEAFQKKHPDVSVHILLSRKNTAFDIGKYTDKFHFHFILIQPFPNTFSFKSFPFLLNYLQGLSETFRLIRWLRPEVLVSFGSYGSFPSVFAAWLHHIPIVIHEQNRIAGRANQAAGLFAKRFAISFPETLGHQPLHKTVHTGYPLRSSLRHEAQAHAQSKKDLGKKFRILVLGGSQGSKAVNEFSLAAFSQFSSEEKNKVAVIHITSQSACDEVRSRYETLGLENQVLAFTEKPEIYYRQADLVIGRAGAGTIFEIAAFGLPAILIPYPYAHGHQRLNAVYAEDRNACIVLEEKGLNGTHLKSVLSRLMNDSARLEAMGQRARFLDVVDADSRLVQVVEEIVSFS